MLSTISFVLNTLNLKVIATRIICRARYNMRYNLCLLKICNNFSRLTIHKLQEEGIQSSRKRVRVYICIKKDLRSCYFMYILFLQLPLRQRTLKYELCILSLRCNRGSGFFILKIHTCCIPCYVFVELISESIVSIVLV